MMDPSKIVSWGTEEDRPEREAMRALLIGRAFMAKYRQARDVQEESKFSWWFPWVKKNTSPELQWMWSNERAYKEAYTDAYAQIAGDLILKQTAAGKVGAVWFRTDINGTYGWLFEAACLKADGWKRGDVKFMKGNEKTWTRPSD